MKKRHQRTKESIWYEDKNTTEKKKFVNMTDSLISEPEGVT